MPITHIYGPECLSIVYDYIAHETDTAEAEVPIITEDEMVIIPEDAVFGGGDIECLPGDVVCCVEPSVFLFTNQLRTEIVWGDVMRTRHGHSPSVFVYYYSSVDGSFSIVGDYTKIAFVGNPLTKIVVDHGGLSTGFLKVV